MNQTKNFTLKVTLEMLKDRGYSRIDNDHSPDSISGTRDDSRIVVKFIDREKVSVDDIRQIVQWVGKAKFTDCIMVLVNSPSPQVKTFLNDSDMNIKIEMFGKYELGVNITKHELVPRHILLNKTERREILDRYIGKNIPQIKVIDPVSKYYGVEKGDIFHIIRKSGMTYRIVV